MIFVKLCKLSRLSSCSPRSVRFLESLPRSANSTFFPEEAKSKQLVINSYIVPCESNLPSLELSEPLLTRTDVQKAIDEYQHFILNRDLPLVLSKEPHPTVRAISEWPVFIEYQLYMFSKSNFTNRYRRFELMFMLKERTAAKQAFNPERHGALGSDLAVAHFIVYRKGRVRFKDSEKWCVDYNKLPNTMDSKLKVVELDTSACGLFYEAMDNLYGLRHLEHLDLSENPEIDDWALDKICCHLRVSKKFKTLNLSNNYRITLRGIESLVRLPSLEILILSGTEASLSPFFELTIHLLKEVKPNLRVIV